MSINKELYIKLLIDEKQKLLNLINDKLNLRYNKMIQSRKLRQNSIKNELLDNLQDFSNQLKDY